MIYLDLETITDSDPVILKFKLACLDKMKKPRYISWIKPLEMHRTPSGEIMCYAPTPWFAQYISTNDFLGFGSFLHEIGIPAVLIGKPDGKLAGKILKQNPKPQEPFRARTLVEMAA